MPTIWFITGASSGIGKCMLEQLLVADNDAIIIAAVRQSELFPAQLSVSADAYPVSKLDVLHLDLFDRLTFKPALTYVLKKYGKLDYFIGCAGIGGDLSEIEGLPQQVITDNFQVNLFGTFGVIQTSVELFRLKGGFKIFQFTSETAIHPFPGTGWYGASKAALENLLGTYTQELAPSWNIQIHCIALGAYLTRMSQNITVFPIHPAYVGTHMESVIRPLCMGLERPTAAQGAAECLAVITRADAETPFHLIVGQDSKALMEMEKIELEKSLAFYNKWV
ncbi:NAD(P)-binding protein [Hymenopellis radicata]|nr:NAD(P)-binding protein [Hymenopellis radicata]